MDKIKALHSLGSLSRGGIETWLMNIVRQKDPRLQIDFVVNACEGEAGAYESEALKLGCKIFYRPTASKFQRRMRAIGLSSLDNHLQQILEEGKYDVLHVHGQELIADALKSAYFAKTKVRVAHCHSTKLARGKSGPIMWLRWLRYRFIERKQISRYATDLVACGRDAGRLMVGDRWAMDTRCQVIYCGVSLAAFELAAARPARTEFLNRYDLPADAIVIGHAGSMGPTHVKNHKFITKIFAALSERSPKYHLFLAGDGPFRLGIKAQLESLGLLPRVRMPGSIPDIPAHMVNLFDAHILPSLLEGLPVVAIEATAAGLYTVMSDNVTEEIVNLIPTRMERVSLDAPLYLWADRVEHAVSLKEATASGIALIEAGPLTITHSVNALVSLYQQRLPV